MVKPDLITEKNVEPNFRRNFNVCKYRELANPTYKKLFNPRDFGILLWSSHDQIVFYKTDYRKIIRYFTSSGLSKHQLLYLLENLQLTFKKSLFPSLTAEENNNEINLCLDFIAIKCDKLTRQLNTDIYRQCYLLDFLLIKRNLEEIPDIFDKLEYLESIRADFLQFDNFPGSSQQTNFITHCDEEIRKFTNILQYKEIQSKTALHQEPPLKTPEHIFRYITDRFNAIDASKWEYVFRSQQDSLFFTNLLTDYFSGKPVDLNFSLILQPRCKTRLCALLNFIYHKFNSTPLKFNTLFLSLIRNLSPFQNLPDPKIYQDLIKHSD